VETSEPKIDDTSRNANFTNELGYGGSVRFLKNIMGLWLLQETRRDLAAAGLDLDYADLNLAAAAAPALRSLVYPNHDEFLKPGNMIERIRSFCKATAQTAPETPGEIARCILESLALSYADMIDQLRITFGFQIDSLHIVGGGSQSKLLNQFSADATGLPVLAGPVEATALGNVLIQALTDGELASLSEMRQIIRNSFSIERFEPIRSDQWMAALERYRSITRQ
jgi:rhamnulokinase